MSATIGEGANTARQSCREGHGDIKRATSSFLNEIEYQLSELVNDQNELTASLTNYREGLLGHIDWAMQTAANQVQRFQAIERQLGEMGR